MHAEPTWPKSRQISKDRAGRGIRGFTVFISFGLRNGDRPVSGDVLFRCSTNQKLPKAPVGALSTLYLISLFRGEMASKHPATFC